MLFVYIFQYSPLKCAFKLSLLQGGRPDGEDCSCCCAVDWTVSSCFLISAWWHCREKKDMKINNKWRKFFTWPTLNELVSRLACIVEWNGSLFARSCLVIDNIDARNVQQQGKVDPHDWVNDVDQLLFWCSCPGGRWSCERNVLACSFCINDYNA